MFVSYAQNFEDVMLNRVFGNLGGGFYIDVGAWHPDVDSVTKHFYEMGWSGVNIEPSNSYFKLLKKRRKRDVNLQLAIGRSTGTSDFFEVQGSGLSSLGENSATRAKRYGFSSRRYQVQVVTLQTVCEEYCAGRPISFLKIDVEGSEKDVIESLDWRKHRPLVVVVEAVHPDTREPMWDSWESTLFGADYVFVWFDGINRYYLRKENEDLSKHFQVPPGLVDGFVIKSSHPLSMRLGAKFRLALKELIRPGVYNLAAKIHSLVKG